MTKEAKIGMLTGLGVIVLIGVLLSQYLGDKNLATGNVATGQMAPLPVGASYRDQVTSPVGAPAMAPAWQVVQMAGGTEIATPVAHDMVMPPVMVAAQGTDVAPTEPVVAGPVAPIEAGPVLADNRMDGPPVITPRDTTVPVKLSDALKAGDGPRPVVTHTVAAGDTLAKIAKQYYGASKNSDIQRIVLANKGVLKDTNTMLVVKMKLAIPGVTPAGTSMAPTAPVAGPGRVAVKPTPATSTENVVVYMPSSSMTQAVPPTGVVQSPGKADGPKTVATKGDGSKSDSKAAAKTYVVQPGDTLEKIARKLAPSKTTEMVQKLMSVNGIKDPTRLQAKMTLKVPA